MSLTEGLYDKFIFKAIFMAGSPGAGKSTVSKQLLSHFGFKEVNIDKFIEFFAKTKNLDPSDMENWPREYISKSADLSTAQLAIYLKGRLPLLIDGTGRNYEKITNLANSLTHEYGYDCGLIFVNTSLEVSLERNKSRERQVDLNYLKQAWKETQENVGKFQDFFGNNMFIIDNTNTPDLYKVSKRLSSFINSPVSNPNAKRWIADEKNKRKRN